MEAVFSVSCHLSVSDETENSPVDHLTMGHSFVLLREKLGIVCSPNTLTSQNGKKKELTQRTKKDTLARKQN